MTAIRNLLGRKRFESFDPNHGPSRVEELWRDEAGNYSFRVESEGGVIDVTIGETQAAAWLLQNSVCVVTRCEDGTVTIGGISPAVAAA